MSVDPGCVCESTFDSTSVCDLEQAILEPIAASMMVRATSELMVFPYLVKTLAPIRNPDVEWVEGAPYLVVFDESGRFDQNRSSHYIT